MKKRTNLLKVILVIFILNVSNLFSQWEQCGKNSGEQINGLDGKGNNIYAATNKGIFYSSNLGIDWKQISNSELETEKFICVTLNGNDILAGNRYHVYKSNNIGKSWTIFSPQDKYLEARRIKVYNKKVLIGADNGLYISEDYGKNWSQSKAIDGFVQPGIRSFEILDNAIYIASWMGIYRTSNNGSTWQNISNWDFDSSNNIGATEIIYNNYTFYSALMGDGIVKSTNYGNSWSKINKGLRVQAISSLIISNNIFIAGSLEGGIYVSTNYGESWFEKNENLNNLNIKCLLNNGEYIFAGTDDSKIYRAKISDLITNVTEENIPSKSIINIFPNPIQNKAKIGSYELFGD